MSDASGIRFVPLHAEHLPLLHTWLTRPHAAQWWQPTPSIEELHADYIAVGGEPNATRAYLAFEHDTPIGFIQCYVVMGSGGGWWEEETDPGARGIDQFLADETRLSQGLGRRMIRAFVERLFQDPAVTVVQTDPSPHNLRAIRCYRAAGFQDVGEVMTPDGPALLMRCHRS
ncbi:GNAT family N-acetyltransferase [Piscinibacter sp. HJYY11]|uniref:GNAT family N-acetyltransferase n=1 Tax=Piscinibacter sp. HJYY11 TaxID=2801333 RepID=UPI001F22C0A1|nr:GNAT family N-acetyltransferase [Piscinibacter sp. HJYY11]